MIEVPVSVHVVTSSWGPVESFGWADRPKKVKTYLETGDVPRTLPELVAWAQSLLDQVPPEYRDSTAFSWFDPDGGPEIYASWSRPETPEDVERRQREHEASLTAALLDREKRERAELARLKAKYEASR